MVVGDKAVVEAQSNQRYLDIIDGCFRETLYVSAEFIAEIPHPSAAEHTFRRFIIVASVVLRAARNLTFEFVLIKNFLKLFKGVFFPCSEFKYLFRLGGPVTESVRVCF